MSTEAAPKVARSTQMRASAGLAYHDRQPPRGMLRGKLNTAAMAQQVAAPGGGAMR